MLSWAMCTAALGSGLHGCQRGAFREDLRVEDGRGQREDDEASVGDNYFTPRRKLGRTAGGQTRLLSIHHGTNCLADARHYAR